MYACELGNSKKLLSKKILSISHKSKVILDIFKPFWLVFSTNSFKLLLNLSTLKLTPHGYHQSPSVISASLKQVSEVCQNGHQEGTNQTACPGLTTLISMRSMLRNWGAWRSSKVSTTSWRLGKKADYNGLCYTWGKDWVCLCQNCINWSLTKRPSLVRLHWHRLSERAGDIYEKLGDWVTNLCKVEAPEPSLAAYLFDNRSCPQKQQSKLSL